MSRIDHARKAQSALESTRAITNGLPFDTLGFAQMMTAEAQVHATLALVEQQRIANLIALAQQSPVFGMDAVQDAHRALIQMVKDPEDGEYTHRVRPDIAAALGIEARS